MLRFVMTLYLSTTAIFKYRSLKSFQLTLCKNSNWDKILAMLLILSQGCKGFETIILIFGFMFWFSTNLLFYASEQLNWWGLEKVAVVLQKWKEKKSIFKLTFARNFNGNSRFSKFLFNGSKLDYSEKIPVLRHLQMFFLSHRNNWTHCHFTRLNLKKMGPL